MTVLLSILAVMAPSPLATAPVVVHTATPPAARRRSWTPFPGPGGTRWAIPWYIVACESHGRWDAWNRSGAIGPYQLLGHGAPWPANTPGRRRAHHRIARQLWLRYGSRPWVCA